MHFRHNSMHRSIIVTCPKNRFWGNEAIKMCNLHFILCASIGEPPSKRPELPGPRPQQRQGLLRQSLLLRLRQPQDCLFDPDLQLRHRRLPGGPAGGHPFPVPILQTPIGSLPLTGSASRRAIPLGSWMFRQTRVGWGGATGSRRTLDQAGVLFP